MDANNYVNRELKEQYSFLKEVDKFALTNAVYALENGYKRFFQKKGGHPNFKSKHHSGRSYTTNVTNHSISLGATYIKLPKLGKVKAVIHRKAPENWILKSATITKEKDGTYYCAILYEYEAQVESVTIVDDTKVIGLDYKSDGLYMDSDGRVCGTPQSYRKSQDRLAKAQRKCRHKKVGSKNYRKQQKKVARIHRKAANQRKDFLHKKSTEIANQYPVVCVENLNMRAMSNHGFGNGKATLDNGYGMFLAMLDYKLKDRGGVFVRVDKWYKSSQICCKCGNHHKVTLSDRTYRCDCGNVMDRDHNAAINIKREGLRIYREVS